MKISADVSAPWYHWQLAVWHAVNFKTWKMGIRWFLAASNRLSGPRLRSRHEQDFLFYLFFFPTHTQELSLEKWWFSKTNKQKKTSVGRSRFQQECFSSLTKFLEVSLYVHCRYIEWCRTHKRDHTSDAEILPQHQKTGQGTGERDLTVLLLVSPIWFILPPKSSLAFKKKDEFGSILGLRTAGLLL